MNNFSQRFLSCCLKSRASYEQLLELVDLRTLSPDVGYLVERIADYYKTDALANSVDVPTLQERIKLVQVKESKAELLNSVLDESVGIEVSPANFVDLLRETKLQGMMPAVISAMQDPSKAGLREQLLTEYLDLCLSADDGEVEESYHNVSIEESLNDALDMSKRMFLAPTPLNEMVGGLGAEDHLILAARPEVGKTALILSMACGLAYHGNPGIVFLNEDATNRIVARAQSCMTGMTAEQMRGDPRAAQERLNARGWNLVRFIPLTPGTIGEIEKYVKRYQPSWIIIDQLRNIETKSENRTIQLENVAKGGRYLAKKYKMGVVSVTQAGDSAEDKLFLGMGDIDGSNTGIPAQCDIMVLVGANTEYMESNRRVLNVVKNKITGLHGHCVVRIRPEISKYEGI